MRFVAVWSGPSGPHGACESQVLQGNDANVTVEVAQEPGHRGGACACVLSLPEKNHPRTSSVVVHFIGAFAQGCKT